MLTKPFYGRVFFTTDGGANAGNSGKADETPDGSKPDGSKPADAPDEFKPITSESELAAWKGRTKKAIIEEVKADLLREQEQRDADAKAEADRKAAEDRGAFEEVKQSLTKERDDAKAAETELRGKVDRYEALTKSRVDAIKGELPAEAVEDFPAEADAIDQLEWLDGRKALLAKLAPAAVNGNGHPRVPPTPPPGGPVKPDIRENLKASGIRYT